MIQFSRKNTTDTFQKLSLGKANNFIISNDSINALILSTSPNLNQMIAVVNPNEVLEFKDIQWQSMYECKEYEYIEFYVRCEIIGNQTSYRLWWW